MRFTSSLLSIALAYADEDATYLLQSQVLRAAVSDHQNASWQSCGGSVDGDNNAGAAISGGGPAPGISDSCSCKSACDARTDCAGWTFTANNRGFSYDGCVLRGNWGAVVRNCNGFCTSAKKAISTCGGAEGDNNAGVAISGGGPVPGISDSCSCKSACDARADCAGWTFSANNRGFSYDGCVLRGNWGAVVRNCNGFCASAKKTISTCGGAEGENNAGAAISGGGPAPGVSDSCSCKSACDARTDCAGWTFTANNRGFSYDGCVLRGNWGAVVRNCNGFCASAKKEVKSSGSCSGETPRCGGVACVDGVWTCGGSTGADATISPGTDSPGGDTEVTDADCLDADKGFGPGFTCANTQMYCSTDSGDGMTVGACCPTKCKKEFENKKKNNRAENKAKNDIERRIKRNENERSRKQAEKARKKNRKDTEWENKRDLREGKNKNEEGERKNKRGLTENARKNEQNWKKNKEARRKAANKRENNRKEKRAKSAPAPTPPSKQTRRCKKKKKNWNKCAGRKKCEKGQKKKGSSAPSC